VRLELGLELGVGGSLNAVGVVDVGLDGTLGVDGPERVSVWGSAASQSQNQSLRFDSPVRPRRRRRLRPQQPAVGLDEGVPLELVKIKTFKLYKTNKRK